MKRFLQSIAKKMTHLFVAVVLFIALLIATVRLITPILNTHKLYFEQIASDYLQRPVIIQNIDVSWYRYYPEISLENVTILNQTDNKPILRIQKIQLFVSLLQSFLHLKPEMAGMMVSGSSVNIHQNVKGEITVQGFPTMENANQVEGSEAKFNDLMNFLSQQSNLILNNIDILYTGFNGQKRFVTLNNLAFINSGFKHTIKGNATLHQSLPTDVTMVIKWRGQNFDLQKMNAESYLYVSGLNLKQWAQDYQFKNLQLKNGIVSAKIWAVWKNNAFQKIQGVFQGYNLELFSNVTKEKYDFNRISANIGWLREGGREIVAGDDILIDFKDHLWPVTSFYFSFLKDQQGQYNPEIANFGFIDLKDARIFLKAMGFQLPNELNDVLTKVNLTGSLERTTITLPNGQANTNLFSINTEFNHLRFKPWNNYPGVKNLSGQLYWSKTQGKIILKSDRLALDYNKLFPAPINVNELSGKINVERLPNNDLVISPSLTATNQDLTAKVIGNLTIRSDLTPISNLTGNFTVRNVSNLYRYLPLSIFPNNLSKWLKSAFSAGEIQNGQMQLKGDLAKFPFSTDEEGIFEISGNTQGVNLNYSKEWPIVKNINSKIIFHNRRMEIDATHAETRNVIADDVKATINDLGDNPTLFIDMNSIATDFQKGIAYVNASPLANTIGGVFKGMTVAGPLSLKLGLEVPLNEPSSTKVNGTVAFNNNTMNMSDWGLSLNQLAGTLSFTEKSVTAKQITGILFNQPIFINIGSFQENNHLAIRANFQNHLSVDDLQKWLKIPLSDRLKGSTNIKGEIDFGFAKPIEIKLQSNLLGISIENKSNDTTSKNAANEIIKSEKTKQLFTADILADTGKPLQVDLTYGDSISASLRLKKMVSNFQVAAATINIGKDKALPPQEDGLYITGQFNKLDWDQIKKYTEGNAEDGSSPFNIPLNSIKITAKEMLLPSIPLTNVTLEVAPSKNNWSIDLQSSEANGQIEVPVGFKKTGLITAQFQNIYLKSNDSDDSKKSFNFNLNDIPSIVFNANDVTYDQIKLGQITFNAQQNGTGLTIQSFRVLSNALLLQAKGTWSQKGDSTETHLSGNAKSTQVSNLLNNFGIGAKNFISSYGNLTFDLTWDGPPFVPSISTLDGSASIKMGKGLIAGIGQQTSAKMDFGKILSVFSLQSLPRRLTFDFSDLFEKGYSFDSINGDFTFNDGNAFTKNLKFEGPVAGILISGRVGFKNKDLNLNLNVTPYVTSSLPVAATLLTGQPLIGLAALAVNTVVSKVSVYHYYVTGSWNNPEWQGSKTETKGSLKGPTQNLSKN